jgi:MinD-like ATPase involved in chromosome partitioning or flagellar assembly
MLSIDEGKPLVFAEENHPISQIFTKIANSL